MQHNILPVTRRFHPGEPWSITIDSSHDPKVCAGTIIYRNATVGTYQEDRDGGPVRFTFITALLAQKFSAQAKVTLLANKLEFIEPEDEYLALLINEHIARVGVTSAHKSGRLVYATADEITPLHLWDETLWHEVTLSASCAIHVITPMSARSIAKRVHARGVSLAGKLVWDGEQWVDFDSLS